MFAVIRLLLTKSVYPLKWIVRSCPAFVCFLWSWHFIFMHSPCSHWSFSSCVCWGLWLQFTDTHLRSLKQKRGIYENSVRGSYGDLGSLCFWLLLPRTVFPSSSCSWSFCPSILAWLSLPPRGLFSFHFMVHVGRQRERGWADIPLGCSCTLLLAPSQHTPTANHTDVEWEVYHPCSHRTCNPERVPDGPTKGKLMDHMGG